MELPIVLGVVAVGLIIGAFVIRRKAGWLAEAAPVDAAHVGAAVGRLVRVAGSVQAGPAGTVQGPLSQQAVAWWSFRVDEEWRQMRRGVQGDRPGPRRRRTLERGQSTQPFALLAEGEPQGATILVDGNEVQVDGAPQTMNRRDHGSLLGQLQLGNVSVGLGGAGRGGQSFVQREWALLEGTRVEAVDTVSRGTEGALHLVKGDRGGLFVTTKAIDTVIKRTQLLSLALCAGAIAAGTAAIILAA